MSSTTANPETPFTINIPQSQIDLLKRKLELTVFPDELDGAGWKYGVPLEEVKRLVGKWQYAYDWKSHERRLNDELPQFKRDITVDGFGSLSIHYVHKRSKVDKAIPLLFVHGWPGSFLEVRKILPLLTENSKEHPSFHVVTYSLPGYGFSEGATKPGFGLSQYAEVGHKLMLALGYSEYVTQGGDWGFFITRRIAALYGGKHSKAWHTNMQLGHLTPPSFLTQPTSYITHLFKGLTDFEKAGLARTAWFREEGFGYNEEQSTQPQTLGYSLADSPAGLLAWIYEKLVNWTDGYPWEDEEVLTWISIYWFSTAGPAASVRIYYERRHDKSPDKEPTIPHGVSYFPKELFLIPKSWLNLPNLVFTSQHERGGHFAAHEQPNALVDDMRKMFGKGGPAYGVVPGKDGYPTVSRVLARM